MEGVEESTMCPICLAEVFLLKDEELQKLEEQLDRLGVGKEEEEGEEKKEGTKRKRGVEELVEGLKRLKMGEGK